MAVGVAVVLLVDVVKIADNSETDVSTVYS